MKHAFMYTGTDEEGVAKYDARIMYATPTPGLAEIEPSMNWNPSVVAGIGVVADPAVLYNDMHSYLASSGMSHPCCMLLCTIGVCEVRTGQCILYMRDWSR